MSTYKDDLIDKHRTQKGIFNLIEYEAAFSEACAEVDRLRTALAAAQAEVERTKAENGFGFHWIMARCTEAVEMYEEHVEGYNAPQPPVTTEEAVIADQKAKLAALAKECEALREDKERLDWMAQSYDNAGLNEVRTEEEAQCFEEWYGKLKRAGKGNAYAVRFAIDMARQPKHDAARTHAQEPKP